MGTIIELLERLFAKRPTPVKLIDILYMLKMKMVELRSEICNLILH